MSPKWMFPVLLTVLSVDILKLVPQTAWAGDNVWTSLGPDGGGAALVVDPQVEGTLYASTAGGGWFRSTDAGATWQGMKPLPSGTSPGALVIDPQSGTMYAATNRTGPPSGTLFKSTDGGASWRAVLTGVSATLAIDAGEPQIVYAGGYNEIFITTNGGASWVSSSSGLPRCCLNPRPIVNPRNTSIVYAATETGLFKSTNRGASWSALYLYSDPGAPRPWSIEFDPQDPDTLYAVMGSLASDGRVPRGIYKSRDGGASWVAVNSPLLGDFALNGALSIDQNGVIYAGTGSGLFRSTDGGADWHAVDSGLGTGGVGAPTIDPRNSNTLYVSTETDIYKSTDSAVTWNPINKGLRAMPIFELSVDPRNPDTLYGSERRGIIKSTDGGASWKRLLDTVNTRAVYIDPKDSNTLYAAAGWTLDSKRVLKSVDGGGTWTSASKGFPDSTCPLVSALSIDPENTGTLYASLWPGGGGGCRDEAGGAPDHHSGGLWKTTDSGISWAKVASPPLGGGFESLAIQPQNSHVLYASNSKGLYRSTDAGMTWEVLSNKPRTEFSALLIDPLTPSTLYITSEDSGVLKSIDAGLNWQAVNSGLPSQYFNQKDNYRITSLVLDARNPNTLFANAGGFGVYRSSDGGASWQAMNAGLTTFSIWRLAIDPTGPKLYAATDGGVFTITF